MLNYTEALGLKGGCRMELALKLFRFSSKF